MQYFFNLALPKDHRFEFSQPCEDALMPGPPKQNKCNAINNYDALVYITNQEAPFFQKKGFLSIVQ
jgi:hypothetical protein